jgi:hypothetical protein
MNTDNLTIEEIVSAIRATREEFSDLFLQAQVQAEAAKLLTFEERLGFEAVVGADATVENAFRVAVEYAESHGWLDHLVEELIASDRESGVLKQKALNNSTGAGAQAMMNLIRGFGNSEVLTRGSINAKRWTARIRVENGGSGTCFLISSNHVLTSWHVVKSLFRNVNGQWEPMPGQAFRLKIQFDAIMKPVGLTYVEGTPVDVDVHQDWCVCYSPCTVDEINKRIPTHMDELPQRLDFVVIRLRNAIGFERNHANMDSRITVPKAGGQIWVFQHPQGNTTMFDVAEVLSTGSDSKSELTRFRFMHDANTLEGSSGSPCFDKNFMIFGIHQARWRRSNEDAGTNVGVPLRRILEYMKERKVVLPPPEPNEKPLHAFDENDIDSEPIIGCDRFRNEFWDVATQLGASRKGIIIINGEKGSGKSYRLRIAAKLLLPDANHLKIELTHDQLRMGAKDLASALCRNANATSFAVDDQSIGNSTLAAWIRTTLVPETLRALDLAREQRKVWIMLKDMNQADFFGDGTKDYLFLLFEKVREHDWLYCVLDGWQGDFQENLVPFALRHVTDRIQQEHIRNFMQRRFAGLAHDEKLQGAIDYAATQLFRQYASYSTNMAIQQLIPKLREATDLLKGFVRP